MTQKTSKMGGVIDSGTASLIEGFELRGSYVRS